MAWRGCRAGALLGQGSGHPDLPWESSPCSLVPFLSPPASRLPLQSVPGPPSSSLSEARGLVLPQPVLGPSLAGPWDGCVRRPLPAGAEGAEGLPSVGSVWGQGAGHFLASLPRYRVWGWVSDVPLEETA